MAQQITSELEALKSITKLPASASSGEFEVWRKTFLTKLYDCTKDAVEVAHRNYLESRLATGMKREMQEIREKYLSLLYNPENPNSESDLLSDFETLEKETDLAMNKLKERNDAYKAISSSTNQLAFKVESMTLKELEAIQLPNYSSFLYDSEIVSFGPLSERWEKLKKSLDEQIVGCLQRPILGRSCSGNSHSSSLNASISEFDSMDDNHGNDTTSADGDSVAKQPGSTASGTGIAVETSCNNSSQENQEDQEGSNPDKEVFVVGCEVKKLKPKVALRTKNNRSFKRQISITLQQLLSSATQTPTPDNLPSVVQTAGQ